MSFVTEYDENENIIKEYAVDEYGNIDIDYVNKELNNDSSINIGKIFKSVEASYRMELKLNKELYEQGIISKELHSKVENIILSKLKVFDNRVKA